MEKRKLSKLIGMVEKMRDSAEDAVDKILAAHEELDQLHSDLNAILEELEEEEA